MALSAGRCSSQVVYVLKLEAPQLRALTAPPAACSCPNRSPLVTLGLTSTSEVSSVAGACSSRASSSSSASSRHLPGELHRRHFSFVKVQPSKEKKAGSLIKLLPHLPAELVAVTTSFLRREKNLKNLLSVIYSPAEPGDTDSDRAVYEAERRRYYGETRWRYLSHLDRHDARVEERRRALEESTLAAIRALPAELYHEAVASDNDPHPEGEKKSDIWPKEMLFHNMYRKQIFTTMTFLEKKRLQCFQNLMRIRYPHAEAKVRDPEQFWIPESQYVSRQRETARNKNAKMSRTLSPVNLRSGNK